MRVLGKFLGRAQAVKEDGHGERGATTLNRGLWREASWEMGSSENAVT